MTIVSLEAGHAPSALLIVPALRARSDLIALTTSACYHWVATDAQALTAIAILSGFASPATSADLPAARATCAAVRARAAFPSLIRASLRQVAAPRSGLILARFWDAFLGTPPQSDGDGKALRSALNSLVDSPDLRGSLHLLLAGLQARASETSVVCRYGACAPLLRIAGALLASAPLVAALTRADLLPHLRGVLQTIMGLAADGMGGGAEVVACSSMHDLIAAMSLEVIAIAVSQPQGLSLYSEPQHPKPPASPSTVPPAEPSAAPALAAEHATSDDLRRALQGLLNAAVRRHESQPAVRPLSRLTEALRRLYGALQHHGGRLLLSMLQANASDEVAARRVNDHLIALAAKAPPPGSTTPALPTTALSPSAAADTASYQRLAAVSVAVVGGAHCQLPRAIIRRDADAPQLAISYPVLPPAQPFSRIGATIDAARSTNARSSPAALTSAEAGIRDAILSLPEPPPTLDGALDRLANTEAPLSRDINVCTVGDGDAVNGGDGERRCGAVNGGDGERRGGAAVRVGLGEDGRQLVAMERVGMGALVAEYCGELLADGNCVIRDLAKYEAIWPPQLYMLRIGTSPLALDISRVASVARFAEHSAMQPTCDLQAYRMRSASTGWVARVCVIARQPLEPGDVITLDYTSYAVGGRASHIQSDWITRLRTAPKPGRLLASITAVAPTSTLVGASAGGGGGSALSSERAAPQHGLAAIQASHIEEQHRNAIRALERLRHGPVDHLRIRFRKLHGLSLNYGPQPSAAAKLALAPCAPPPPPRAAKQQVAAVPTPRWRSHRRQRT